MLDALRTDSAIASIDVTMVQIPLPRDFRGSVYSVTHKNALITRVRTRDGMIGEAVNGEGQAAALSAARKILVEDLAPLLLAMTPAASRSAGKSCSPRPIASASIAAP